MGTARASIGVICGGLSLLVLLAGCDQLQNQQPKGNTPKATEQPSGPQPDDLRARADGGDADAMAELADQLRDDDKLDEAFVWYQKAAEAGVAFAKLATATMLEKGQGTPADLKAARVWYEKAAESDVPKARRWLTQRAEKGEGEAAMALARIQLRKRERAIVAGNRTGAAEHLKTAKVWLEKGAEAGDASSATRRAVLELDVEIKPDLKAAAAWLAQAAEKGNGEAMVRLGDLHASGAGASKSGRKALELWQQAAAAGHADGHARLGDAHALGIGTRKDYDAAVAAYQKGVEGGSARAMAGMARLHREGKGVEEPSKAKGLEWLTRAAEAGDVPSMLLLGDLLLVGKPFEDLRLLLLAEPELHPQVQANREKAIPWYDKAAALHDIGAMKKAGDLWSSTNEHYEPNYTRAMLYWERLMRRIELYQEAGAASKQLEAMRLEVAACIGLGTFNARNPSEGKEILTKVAEEDSALAYRWLAEISFFGLRGNKFDPEKGYANWRKAAELGDAVSEQILKALTTDGKFDPVKVVAFVEEAEKAGDARAKMMKDKFKSKYKRYLPKPEEEKVEIKKDSGKEPPKKPKK